MSNTYTVLVPKILTAAFAPNPADINSKTVLSVRLPASSNWTVRISGRCTADAFASLLCDVLPV